MASEDAPGQGLDALEPEIRSCIRIDDDLAREALILRVNTALKEFETRFASDIMPTSLDIHMFLDEMLSEASLILSLPRKHLYNWEALHEDFISATDKSLGFVISRLSALVKSDLLLPLLNDMSHEKSLIAKAAELMLTKSLRLLLANGAKLDEKTIPKNVAVSMERIFMQMMTLENTGLGSCLRRAELRNLLDLTTLSNSREFVFFSISDDLWAKPIGSLLLASNKVWRCRVFGEARLGWIHVPSTNGLVSQAVLEKFTALHASDFIRHFRPSVVAPGDPYLNYREIGYWSPSIQPEAMPCKIIVFPCLTLTTVGQHAASRKQYTIFRDSLTTDTSGQYSAECTVHLERTLDEAYFPGLGTDELMHRNNDQIVSSKYRDISDWDKSEIPILVVPQLWLWRVANTIVSAHSLAPQSNFSTSSKMGYKGPLFRSEGIQIQLGYILADLIDEFGKEITVDNGRPKIPPTLDLFESRVVSVLSEVKTYVRETKRNAIDYTSEANFLHVLSDCRSELAMIRHILEQQEDIVVSLLNDAKSSSTEPMTGDWTGGWTPVKNAQAMLKQYQKRVQKIDGDAERIEKNVQDLLNLKRTYASVQDSHAGVLLSVAAIGFAIVTVIFAPLAFLAGLFALNFQGFDRLRVKQGYDTKGVNPGEAASDGRDFTTNVGSNDGPVYDSGKMAGIFLGTEILTVLVTCLLVWLSLRWFGIDFTDFRMGREEKQERKQQKRMNKSDVDAEKKAAYKEGEKSRKDKEPIDTTTTGAKKAWSERLTYRRQKTTTQAQEGEERV